MGYMSDANVILTFEDEQGREWLAAGFLDFLRRYGDSVQLLETIAVDRLKDRSFTIKRFTIIDRSWASSRLMS